MADDSNASAPFKDSKSNSPSDKASVKSATSWVLPVIAVAVLASAFCFYYFVYVTAQREYLVNRNFRSLAVLGDQFQAMVSIHGSILEFSSDLANRKHEDLKQFVVPRKEDLSKGKQSFSTQDWTFRSHRTTVSSPPADASVFPSGLNARCSTRSGCP